jgi:hypothetical protein
VGYIAFGQGGNSIKTSPKQPNSAVLDQFWLNFRTKSPHIYIRITDVQTGRNEPLSGLDDGGDGRMVDRMTVDRMMIGWWWIGWWWIGWWWIGWWWIGWWWIGWWWIGWRWIGWWSDDDRMMIGWWSDDGGSDDGGSDDGGSDDGGSDDGGSDDGGSDDGGSDDGGSDDGDIRWWMEDIHQWWIEEDKLTNREDNDWDGWAWHPSTLYFIDLFLGQMMEKKDDEGGWWMLMGGWLDDGSMMNRGWLDDGWHGSMMDQWWINDGSMMDQWWINDGSMIDQWWINDGSMMDQLMDQWWINDGRIESRIERMLDEMKWTWEILLTHPSTLCVIKGSFQAVCTSVIRIYMWGDFVRRFNQNWSKTAEFGCFGLVLIEFSPWSKAM